MKSFRFDKKCEFIPSYPGMICLLNEEDLKKCKKYGQVIGTENATNQTVDDRAEPGSGQETA